MSNEQNQSVPPTPDVPPPTLPPIELVSLHPERLEGPTPSGVPDDVPPLPPGLDPDLTLAFQSGNTAVINAIRAGATTSQQVVDRMIQMGFTTGLPPEVQRLVDQRQMEVRERNEAENRRLLEAGKDVLTTAAFLTGFGDRDSYGGEKASKEAGTSALYSKPWTEMNEFQRAAFLDGIMGMNQQDWGKLSDAERKQTMDSVSQSLEECLRKNEQNRVEIREALLNNTSLGATPEERQRNTDMLEKESADAKQRAMREMGHTQKDMATLSQEDSDKLGQVTDRILQEKFEQLYPGDPEKAALYTQQARTFTANDKREWDYTATHNTLRETPNDPAARKRLEALNITQKGAAESKYSAQDQKDSTTIAATNGLTSQINAEATGPSPHAPESRAEAKAHELDEKGLLRAVVEESHDTKQAAAYQARTENLKARSGADPAKIADEVDLGFTETAPQQQRLTVNASTLNGATLTALGAPEQTTAPPTLTAPPLRPQPKQAQQAGMGA